jgi:adenine-specific DNA-methyltransferase
VGGAGADPRGTRGQRGHTRLMAREKAKKSPTKVNALKHKDKRKNIPTDELRGFISEEERKAAIASYPRWRTDRDRSLDPQLVWRGKDEQDLADLEVPAVPIYIQEKVHPRAIVERLRQATQSGNAESEPQLFDDFNGIEFDELVDFYEHSQSWTNRLILGDALLVMNSLAEKESLKGKVQMIYMDPPYGIDFKSNWQASTQNADVKDGKLADLTREPEQILAFRDTWQDGIHTYLGYLRDRFAVARELLSETGSLFVQISDTNVHLVRSLLDEVFGAENFVSQIVFQTTSGFETKTLGTLGDFILWYSRDASAVKVRKLFEPQEFMLGEGNAKWLLMPDGSYRGVKAAERRGEVELPQGALAYDPDNLISQGAASEPQPVEIEGQAFLPRSGSHWKAGYPEGMERLALAGRIHRAKNSLRYRRFFTDFPYQERGNIWTDTRTGNFTDQKVYVVQTNTKVVERCVLLATDPGDLVLDPTCGSGTTAVAAETWGRRWITVDTSRVSVALARTRLAALRLPYFVLADSEAGKQIEAELSGQEAAVEGGEGDVRKGFVYRRAPHIRLEGIAKNPDLKPGMSKDEIDESIARHAEQELLLDQPYEDKRTIRVCGPFTVESLSPHRMLSPDGGGPSGVGTGGSATFTESILENLLKAGVQNRVRKQRLELDHLEPYAGTWIHAAGEYSDEKGEARRVAVSIGPEHGTVGADDVTEAAKEAVKGVGFDVLLVLGFAFDAHSSEAAKEFQPSSESWAVVAEERKLGKLPVLLVRMNADLSMGDAVLKKTGAGNLFMVFGEPDISIERDAAGQVVVEVHGVDVYDPTTGEIRSDSTDEIACWLIDTDYDEESFFVRDAYFSGANDPYKRLRAALKADIDKEAWESLYCTRSRPFDPPQTGKIAIKVINHHGDEVLKTYEVPASTKSGS